MFAIKDAEIVFPDVVYCVIMNLFARKLPLGQSQTQKTLWCSTTRAERGRKMEQETVQCCHQSKNVQAVAETEEERVRWGDGDGVLTAPGDEMETRLGNEGLIPSRLTQLWPTLTPWTD